ncbi:hypothetical protein DFH09DRAFT_1096815 [Mycena vulgaris]|nr:hypothetical protein DFH09DRAFT_1096815 [Mycena vulgaris]
MTKTQTQSDVLHMAEMFTAASIVLEDDPDEADFLGDSEDLDSWRMDWEIFSRMISLSDWECEKQLGPQEVCNCVKLNIHVDWYPDFMESIPEAKPRTQWHKHCFGDKGRKQHQPPPDTIDVGYSTINDGLICYAA